MEKIKIEQLIEMLQELNPQAEVYVGNITNGRAYHFPLNVIKSETDMISGREVVYLVADRQNLEKLVEETFNAEDKEG